MNMSAEVGTIMSTISGEQMSSEQEPLRNGELE
jgi:hypothetical protein